MTEPSQTSPKSSISEEADLAEACGQDGCSDTELESLGYESIVPRPEPETESEYTSEVAAEQFERLYGRAPASSGELQLMHLCLDGALSREQCDLS